MQKKLKQAYGGLLAAVVVIAIIWFVKSKPANNNPETPSKNNTNNSSTTPKPSTSPSGGSSMGMEGNVWKGTLRISDNSANGNLMLETENSKIYIQTSRDFSSLVDKKVMVEYEGSLESFVLKNITADNQ